MNVLLNRRLTFRHESSSVGMVRFGRRILAGWMSVDLGGFCVADRRSMSVY